MKHSSKEVPIKRMAVLLIIATISGGVHGCSPAPPTPTCPSCPTTTKCPPTPTYPPSTSTLPCPTCPSTTPCPPPPTCPSTTPCPPPPTCPTCPTKTTPSIPTCPTKSCPPIPTCPTTIAGKSCKELKTANPWSGDGTYFIHPDGQSNPVKVYCEMTTDGGGWTVMAYLRSKDQWDYKLFQNNGEVGDIINGFSSGATLKSLNANYTEKLIVYLALEEKGVMLGRQWMMNQRPDTVLFPEINTGYGWSYRDSFGYRKEDARDVCSHGCDDFRGFGMFGYTGGSPDSGWCGTQGGDYGCRDGNNICWQPRNMTLGCNVGKKRCSLLSGDGEGVIYAVR